MSRLPTRWNLPSVTNFSVFYEEIMKFIYWTVAALVSFSSSVFAGNAVNTDAAGVAASGHDVVAYFQMNKPVPGDAKLMVEHEGVKYHFSSTESLNAFKANPSK